MDIEPVMNGKDIKGSKKNESKDEKTNVWNRFTDKICKMYYLFSDVIQITRPGNRRYQVRYEIKKVYTNTINASSLANFIDQPFICI